jgi:hypothetical protein
MPALNTPQFSWVRSRLLRKAQPVPPIFQPEVAADAIVWVAEHDRSELWVGWPTVKAILADKIAPRLADRYLARNGYEAQQTNGLRPPDRPDNLWEPPPGDPGAHGDFDDRARDRSWQLWATKNRRWIALGALAALAGAFAGWRRAVGGALDPAEDAMNRVPTKR